MPLYNLTGIAQNTTDPLQFVVGVNNVLMDGQLGFFLLIAISFIVFIAFFQATADAKKSMTGTMFVAFALSVLLRVANLVSNDVVVGCMILTALTVAVSWKD